MHVIEITVSVLITSARLKEKEIPVEEHRIDLTLSTLDLGQASRF